MRNLVAVLACGIGVFGLVLTAAEKPSDDYVKAMKDLGSVNAGLKKAADSDDFDTLSKSAMTARDAFAVAEAYWKGKADDAFKLAGIGVKASADLGVAAGLKSTEGAQEAVKEITSTCATCHTAHRERGTDGAWQIK
jgi:hypothetical protein